MTAKGYASLAQVAAWYGSPLDTAQAAQASGWLEAAEQAIDTETGNPFLTTPSGIITAERHEVSGGMPLPPLWVSPYLVTAGARLWTRLRPILSVQAIRGYRRGSADAFPLIPLQDYEVDSLSLGRLWVRPWNVWHYFQVDYTVANSVPAAVSEATAMLLAHLLVNPQSIVGGYVTSAQLADIKETYANPDTVTFTAQGILLPADVRAMLGSWARSGTAVMFA